MLGARLFLISSFVLALSACGDDGAGDGDTAAATGDASSSGGTPTTTQPSPTTGTTTDTPSSTGSADDTTSTSAAGSTTDPGTDSGSTGEPLPFEVTSTAYGEGEMIPLTYECGAPAPVMGPGDNLSPPLSWTPGPAGTMSYAIVMRDVDATPPQYPEGIIHWVLYDIPADAMGTPEGVPPGYDVADPAGAHQTNMQSSGFFGYFGPCSPNSINTYVITVHAMDTATLAGVDMASTEIEVAELIESTSIASASLSGES